MQVHIGKARAQWNTLVDRNPSAVLRHRYEFYESDANALPLIISEHNRQFLFPLRIERLFKSFSLATSPIFYHASLLPDPEAVDLTPDILDSVSSFLKQIHVDYLSTCAPIFLPKRCTALFDAWFRRHKADVQYVYVYLISTENTDFEDIWRHRFKRRNREEIRKAEREGVDVIKIDSVDDISAWMDEIHKCDISTLVRQGRWGAYPDSYKDVFLAELIAAKNLLGNHFNIYGALYERHLIAYLVVQEFNKLMEPTKAASRTEFLKKHPNDVLVTHMIKEACERRFHWVEYGFDRVSWNSRIQSVYAGIQRWRQKFGFEEFPFPIYRLGLNRSGNVIRRLYSGREYFIARMAYIPESIRTFIDRVYGAKRRRLSALVYA